MARHGRITTARVNDARTALRRTISRLQIAEGSDEVESALAEFEAAVRADVPRPILRRYWINQPSTLQPDHALHGQNVLALPEPGSAFTDVYFTTGPATSSRLALMSLSPGWR